MTSLSLGLVGLGRMGSNMARRLARGGVRVVGCDATPGAASALGQEGVIVAADSVAALVAALPAPRVVWTMVPAGAATQATIDALAAHLAPGDTIVDGGNANYKDSQRRARELGERGLRFVDCGVSGGVWGRENGYALMFGGDAQAANRMPVKMGLTAPAPGGNIAPLFSTMPRTASACSTNSNRPTRRSTTPARGRLRR